MTCVPYVTLLDRLGPACPPLSQPTLARQRTISIGHWPGAGATVTLLASIQDVMPSILQVWLWPPSQLHCGPCFSLYPIGYSPSFVGVIPKRTPKETTCT